MAFICSYGYPIKPNFITILVVTSRDTNACCGFAWQASLRVARVCVVLRLRDCLNTKNADMEKSVALRDVTTKVLVNSVIPFMYDEPLCNYCCSCCAGDVLLTSWSEVSFYVNPATYCASVMFYRVLWNVRVVNATVTACYYTNTIIVRSFNDSQS